MSEISPGQLRSELAESNDIQKVEALGDDNRLFANQFYQRTEGRNAQSDDELMMYYATHGGATGHAERMAERRKKTNESAA